MGLRFKLLSAVFLIAMLASSDNGMRPFGNVLDVFFALFVLVVLSALALWPNSSSADRVDRAINGSSWADRIEFDTPVDKT